MDRKPVFYGLIGLLAGSAITAGLMVYSAKTQLQTATLVGSTGTTTATPSGSGVTAQTSPSNTTPVPMTPGMMADQHFIVMMIPHHEGAVAMADLALSRGKHPELKKFAETIKTTQNQEIQQMKTWYKQWYGADVPAWTPGRGWYGWNRQQQGNNTQSYWGSGMGRHRNWDGWNNWDRGWQGNNAPSSWGSGTGCCAGRGWMGTNLYALQNAPDFDREFIEQMIPHHQMAVMMAQMVVNSATHPETRNLAQSMIKSQTDEINQMQRWYQTWYQ